MYDCLFWIERFICALGESNLFSIKHGNTSYQVLKSKISVIELKIDFLTNVGENVLLFVKTQVYTIVFPVRYIDYIIYRRLGGAKRLSRCDFAMIIPNCTSTYCGAVRLFFFFFFLRPYAAIRLWQITN